MEKIDAYGYKGEILTAKALSPEMIAEIEKETAKNVKSHRRALKLATKSLNAPKGIMAKWYRRAIVGVLVFPWVGIGTVGCCSGALNKLAGNKPIGISDLNGAPQPEPEPEVNLPEPLRLPIENLWYHYPIDINERNNIIMQSFKSMFTELYINFLNSDPEPDVWSHKEIEINGVDFLVKMKIALDMEAGTYTLSLQLHGQASLAPFYWENKFARPFLEKKSAEGIEL